jgi:hypothetical protein
MTHTIWALPLPSTNIGQNPSIAEIRYRDHDLIFSLLNEDGEEYQYCLTFKGVEAYECTYLTSCSVEMIRTAYDKLIDCGRTNWLIELEEISSRVSNSETKLHHYRIFFDEGPGYEFICTEVLICQPKE